MKKTNTANLHFIMNVLILITSVSSSLSVYWIYLFNVQYYLPLPISQLLTQCLRSVSLKKIRLSPVHVHNVYVHSAVGTVLSANITDADCFIFNKKFLDEEPLFRAIVSFLWSTELRSGVKRNCRKNNQPSLLLHDGMPPLINQPDGLAMRISNASLD